MAQKPITGLPAAGSVKENDLILKRDTDTVADQRATITQLITLIFGAARTFFGDMRFDTRLSVGGAVSPSVRLYNLGTITGSVSSYGYFGNHVVASDATTAAYGIRTLMSTAAATFTVSNLAHFYVTQGTIGAGSAVTNQYGFQVASNLTGATNNYGYYSSIGADTGRWNLFMGGTAQNYLAGNLGLGVTVPTEKLHVSGGHILIQASTPRLKLRPTADTQSCRLDFQNTSGATRAELLYDVTNNYLRYYDSVNSAERLRIDNAGNVGIANASPTEKLDVVGNIKLTGRLNISGSLGTAGQIPRVNSGATALEYVGVTTHSSSDTADVSAALDTITAYQLNLHKSIDGLITGNIELEALKNVLGNNFVIGNIPAAFRPTTKASIVLVFGNASTTTFSEYLTMVIGTTGFTFYRQNFLDMENNAEVFLGANGIASASSFSYRLVD